MAPNSPLAFDLCSAHDQRLIESEKRLNVVCETQARQGVQLATISNQISQLSEVVTTFTREISAKVDAIDTKVDGIAHDVGEIKVEQARMSETLAHHASQIKSLEASRKTAKHIVIKYGPTILLIIASLVSGMKGKEILAYLLGGG